MPQQITRPGRVFSLAMRHAAACEVHQSRAVTGTGTPQSSLWCFTCHVRANLAMPGCLELALTRHVGRWLGHHCSLRGTAAATATATATATSTSTSTWLRLRLRLRHQAMQTRPDRVCQFNVQVRAIVVMGLLHLSGGLVGTNQPSANHQAPSAKRGASAATQRVERQLNAPAFRHRRFGLAAQRDRGAFPAAHVLG